MKRKNKASRQKTAQYKHCNFLPSDRVNDCIYLFISLGGHGQMEPVENIMDFLALHLGLDAIGKEPVTGLTNTRP